MAAIKILPEILSNKIAAGEVVERPASVVKELVENAIDAGSTAISVEIKNGGKSMIRVSDDGSGMGRDDALLSLERHATSKLLNEDDLFAIRTLGFRGEALPSMASVSRFTMTTRTHESDEATQITVSGGKIKNVKTIGAPSGTMIEVSDLFFNTPARKKFLKSTATEMGHITDMIDAFALCYPEIHFKLTHNNKKVRSLVRAEDGFDRAADVLGADVKDSLQPIDYTDPLVSVTGWTSSPAITRSTSQKIFLFVNKRRIKDRGLQYALFEGYKGRLVKGSYPAAAIFMEIAHDRVDVNVHPAKSEVRFSDQHQVYDGLKNAISNIFESSSRPPWEPANMEQRLRSYVSNYAASESKSDDNKQAGEVSESVSSYPKMRDMMLPKADDVTPSVADSDLPSPRPQPRYDGQGFELVTADGPQPTGPFFSSLSIIGQFRDTYIICESDKAIVFVDQHAAHERIVFDTLKKRQREKKSSNQGLLVPETVELSHSAAAALVPLLDEFAQFGMEIDHFGQNTFAVKAVPEVISDIDIAPMIIEIAETLAETGFAPDTETILDKFLIVMACHGSIRANRKLSEQEMRSLLVRLDDCENPWHCPHGRPTAIKWGIKTIEKDFKRIV